LLADGFVQFVPSTNEMLSAPRGKAETLAQMEQVKGLLEDLRMSVKEMTAQGNRVAVEAESHAIHKPTGRTYNNFYHFLFEIDGGKITKMKEYCDTKHAVDVFFTP
jgi:ketosteroid isomerase-like protein